LNILFKLSNHTRLLLGYYKKVAFSDLLRTEPVSRLFGLDRGMPVDRHYIDRFLAAHQPLICGRILEVAGDTYARRFADPAANPVIDILHPEAKVVPGHLRADLTDLLSLPENLYDCFICTQTYNFIYDPRKAIEGSARLLKPGGVLLATVAGISQISAYDRDRWGDYWRFTAQSAARMFEEVFGKGNVEVTVFGNLPAAKALLEGLAVEDLPDRGILELHDPEYPVVIGIKAVKG
jgi:SAM-dependent methyltransferase